jgi:PAS domain S-box-containing protein
VDRSASGPEVAGAGVGREGPDWDGGGLIRRPAPALAAPRHLLSWLARSRLTNESAGSTNANRGSRPEPALRGRIRLAVATGDAVIIKTVDGIVTSWPQSAQTLFGFSADEMFGQPITRIFPAERLSEEAELLVRIRHGERIEGYRTTRHTKDGRIVNVSISLMPIKDRQGNVVSVLKTIHVALAEHDATPPRERWPAGKYGDVGATIREKIAVGRLRTDRPVMVSIGEGRSRLCDACELPISDEAGYEVDMPGGLVLRVHQTCLTLWREECARLPETPLA